MDIYAHSKDVDDDTLQVFEEKEREIFWIGTRLSRAGNQNLGFFANRYSVYILVAAAAAPQVNRGRESPPSLLL
jgi:hypothetical protein